jgi:SAM-dependent methyltransferase
MQAAPANPFYMPQSPSFLVPARLDAPELLDMGKGTLDDVRANFADLWRINRYLGGINAVTQHLYPPLRQHEEPITLVDIGSGSAHIAREIKRWAEQQAIGLKLLGLDLSARHLTIAQDQSSTLKFIQADALHLPFSNQKIDYFISCLFLHHFPPEQVVKLLAQTYALARHGIIMSDIVRGYLPLIAFKLGQPIFARNFLTRHDGMVSIQRAYTPVELRQFAQAAGLHNARVHQHFPWRMTLVAYK